MAPVPKGGLVAVTGAAGFIGGWVVRRLLERGYRVRACVRDVDDTRKTAFLKALPGHASGRLTLHAADLDRDGCFDAIFAGCQGVCHVSHVSTYDDPAYVRHVCDHVIASVNASNSVNRVIVTSSIAAVMSEADIHELVRRPVIYEDRYPDESNPIGRCVQNGAYRPWMTVDVRDDADCHIGLLESVAVKNGERYIACSTERRNVEDVCASIDRLLPELGHDTPAVSDDFPERIRAREAELRAIWAGTELRNDRIRAVTGVRFRPLDDSIRDCVESLLGVGGVRPKVRPGFPARG